MKRFKTTGLAAVFGLVLNLLLVVPASAQEDALKGLPGYVDFGELQGVYGEPKVMINLGGSILKFVGGMTKDDPEAAALLENLKGVRINVYSVGGNPDAAIQKVNQVKNMLAGSKWEPIVQVNEDGEKAQIFIKLTGDVMEGLTVMAVDDEEAVFINIIGQLDPAQLSQVMGNFDIDIDGHLELP
ncbi:MAG TPA: DUF4252 domain-containing protein [Xanthomonadales bacterium]|nr:DUF4252 domain-containing protein [Xanthomonadales bacterium]